MSILEYVAAKKQAHEVRLIHANLTPCAILRQHHGYLIFGGRLVRNRSEMDPEEFDLEARHLCGLDLPVKRFLINLDGELHQLQGRIVYALDRIGRAQNDDSGGDGGLLVVRTISMSSYVDFCALMTMWGRTSWISLCQAGHARLYSSGFSRSIASCHL